MTTDCNPVPASELEGVDALASFTFEGYGAERTEFRTIGADPSLSYARSGSLMYSLYPGQRRYPIDSRGDLPHRSWQENGDENFWRSMLFFNERVGHFDLDPNPPVAAGEVWDFVGSRGFTVETDSAILAGGENRNQGATPALGDLRVMSSNTFVFGSDADTSKHFLLYGCPNDTHPPEFKPTAKRMRGKATIACVRGSNNQVLHEFAIPDSQWNLRAIQFVPIQTKLRQMYPDLPLPGETIRIEYRLTSYGVSPTRDESQWVIVGATFGFAVLPLRRVS